LIVVRRQGGPFVPELHREGHLPAREVCVK
jgi:hypothetical protein